MKMKLVVEVEIELPDDDRGYPHLILPDKVTCVSLGYGQKEYKVHKVLTVNWLESSEETYFSRNLL